jgi:hypothetical protein
MSFALFVLLSKPSMVSRAEEYNTLSRIPKKTVPLDDAIEIQSLCPAAVYPVQVAPRSAEVWISPPDPRNGQRQLFLGGINT